MARSAAVVARTAAVAHHSHFRGHSDEQRQTSLFGCCATTRNARPNRTQDAQIHSGIQQTVHDLGAQIEKLTALFNDLHSQVFEPPEQPQSFPATPLQPRVHSEAVPHDEHRPSLLEAIMSGHCNEVRDALERGDCDPNEMYSDIEVNNKTFATATPLVVAALLQQRSMVPLLVAAGASVESTYSFIAGAEQRIWSGTVVHTAIPVGNLDLLTDLANLKADMNTRGSNGASLVWQACYFDQRSILEHLLGMGLSCELEQRAQSQDDSMVSYTPLHAAVTHGHSEIVQALLSAQAKITVDDGKGRTPLDDAIGECHGDIVHQLILKNADIFKQTPVTSGDFCLEKKSTFIVSTSMPQTARDVFSRRITRAQCQYLSSFDRILRTENQVLLSRVTQALARAPNLLDRMSKRNLLQVLASPGDAPIHMMEALFQKQKVVTWEVQDGKTYRRQWKDAMVNTALGKNILSGPHAGILRQYFVGKEQLPGKFAAFVNELFPQGRMVEGQMFVPVTAYMCHVPTVHTDLQILMALVDCPNQEIFRCEGVAAIVAWAWNQEILLSRFGMFLAVLELINFMLISVFMDDAFEQRWYDGSPAWINKILSAVIWLNALFFELFQFIGYWSDKSTMRYWRSPRHWFGILVVVMTGVFVVVFMIPGEEALVNRGEFSAAMGVLLFLKWFKMLVYLRQYKAIAVRTLPITSTMWNVGPFLLVMAVYLFATVNLFYALRNGYGLEDCFFHVYNLVVLGNFDITKLYSRVTLSTPERWYVHFVRAIVIGLSFVIGVTMMNLFIAVLCVAYDEAAQKAQIAFMEARASIVLDQHAFRNGIRYVKKSLRRMLCRTARIAMDAVDVEADMDITHSLTAADIMHADVSHSTFLWFVRPTD